MKFLHLLVLSVLCIIPTLASKHRNYYWIDYNGEIPDNAVRGGQGLLGETIYIGKTADTPGYLVPSKDKLYFAKDKTGAQLTDTNIKVLCTDHPEQMEWVTITKENFRFILNLNIVMGGDYDTERYGYYPWLVGRHIYNEGAVVGGVTTSEFEMHLLANYNQEKKTLSLDEGIQLLTFNPYLPIRGQCSKQARNSGEGYYWKNYYGIVPNCAVPGGRKRDSSVTYIGKTNYNNTIVAGELDPTNKVLNFVDSSKAHKTSTNIQILCADDPSQMEWVDVATKNFWFQWDKHIVLGGHSGLYPYVIGKKEYADREVVGVAVTYGFTPVLNHVYDGTAKSPDTFQILTYNPYQISGEDCNTIAKCEKCLSSTANLQCV